LEIGTPEALAETNRVLGHGRLGPTWVD
jgi:hypothetical protein